MVRSLPRWLMILLPLSLVIMHFHQIGFLFTGDTLSYVEHAYQGGLRTTFLLHAKEWPPGTAFVLNVLRTVSPTPYHTLQHYTWLMSVGTFLSLTILLRFLTRQWWLSFWLSMLFLFIPPQLWMMEAALSESLSLFAGTVALVALLCWSSTPRDRWLLLGAAAAALLPLARYLGVSLLLGLQIGWLFAWWQQPKDQRPSLAGMLALLGWSWVPFGLYLMRNIFHFGSPLGPRDPNTTLTLGRALLARAGMLGRDLTLPALVALFCGTLLPRPRVPARRLLFITLVAMVSIYAVALLLSETRYQALDLFPSRYLSLLYPWILTLCLLAGTFRPNHHAQRFVAPMVFLTSLTFLSVMAPLLYVTAHNRNSVAGAVAANDLRTWCGAEPTTLVLKPLSRHWVGLGARWFCPYASSAPETATAFPARIILTPYELESATPSARFQGPKTLLRYELSAPTPLNVPALYAQQLGWE